MSTVYTIRIDNHTYRIERDKNGEFLVDGEALNIEHVPVPNGTILRFANRSFTTHIERFPENGSPYQVNVNGRSLAVEVEDEKAALLRSLQSDKTTKLHSAQVRSPMPGKITRVLVSEGELIEAGQGVLILEAMKMENEIKAPSAGVVKSVRVKEADAVEKNAILIEIS